MSGGLGTFVAYCSVSGEPPSANRCGLVQPGLRAVKQTPPEVESANMQLRMLRRLGRPGAGGRRSLNTRLTVSLSLMLIPVIGAGLFGVVEQQRTISRSSADARASTRDLATLAQAQDDLHTAEDAGTGWITGTGTEGPVFVRASARVDADLAALGNSTVLGDSPATMDAEDYWNQAKQTFELTQAVPSDQTLQDQQFRRLSDASESNLVSLTSAALQNLPSATTAVQRQASNLLNVLLLAFAIGLGVALVVARRLHSAIGRPLFALQHSARRLGSGDLAHQIEPDSFAEFAEVADAFNSMTDRLRESRRELTHQSFHDELTGMPNRTLLFERVKHALSRGRGSTGVLFIDLDDFKVVNDSLGHACGDELLVHAATRLLEVVRPTDTVARLGGDEFAVLVEDLADSGVVEQLAERVLMSLSASTTLNGQEINPSASVGVAVSGPDDSCTADELIRNADLAMYAAKQDGKRRYRSFDPMMLSGAVERLELESDLRRAVENEELEIYYQPVVDLDTGRLMAMEALARWMHPTRGPIPPLVFIPMAEQGGLIVDLGRQLMRRACAEVARLRADSETLGALRLSVNLSTPELLDPGVVDGVRQALEGSGLAPDDLTLEITESVLMSDVETSMARLRELKALGVRLALDDFGTGYSSLAYLRHFPVDMLKIDKAFIDNIASLTSDDHALVRSIIGLGHTLNLTVVAEGIEDDQQRDELQRLGCNLGQGYLFAKPLPVASIRDALDHPVAVAA
jgi:diguanylate cyclase (GGDEF)-like protein